MATTTTMSFASQINSALEFHNPERAALVAELYGNISLENGAMEGTPETQAFLWTGDIECLRALAEGSATNRGEARSARSLLGGGLQSARVADTCKFRLHSSVFGSSNGETDKLCHNRAGEHPGIPGQKRDAGEMTGEQEEDNDAPRSAAMKKKVCLVKPIDTDRVVLTRVSGQGARQRTVHRHQGGGAPRDSTHIPVLPKRADSLGLPSEVLERPGVLLVRGQDSVVEGSGSGGRRNGAPQKYALPRSQCT